LVVGAELADAALAFFFGALGVGGEAIFADLRIGAGGWSAIGINKLH
jgi:hypothetical protein